MVDRAKIYIKAGDGGNGVVHWRREKFIPKGGPDGGDGGKGGNVYIQTDVNLSTLQEFAYKQKFIAQSGANGSGRRSFGGAGDDLTIKVPLGTKMKLTNKKTGEVREIDFDQEGVSLKIAKAGRGGRGNWHFKSSTNTTPRFAEDGTKGEEFDAELDLKLLADVGLIGLPNVGKSTLLSVLTKATPKIADYEFTTLEPNLGVMVTNEGSLVLADIPGLIEGASEGKGLGDQFLRHVERTKFLVHVLAIKGGDGESETKEVTDRLKQEYLTIRNELKAYEESLLEKPEVIVLNKTDLITAEETEQIVKGLNKKKLAVIPVSCGTATGLEALRKMIYRKWLDHAKTKVVD